MKQLFALLLLSCPLFGQTLTAISVAPYGAAIKTSSTVTLVPTCTYSDLSTDNCTKAGGATYTSSRFTDVTVSSGGLVTQVATPTAGSYEASTIVVKAGSLSTRATIYGQNPADTFYVYLTPDPNQYTFNWMVSPPSPVLNVAVGATVTVGAALVINYNGSATGQPFSKSCNYASSDASKATVDHNGFVTAVAPGTVTITCGQAGNATYGSSSLSGWVPPGTTIALTIVNGGTSNQTWYVRPGGGTPYTATSTNGQCTGLTDADYPGTTSEQWTPSTAYAMGHTIVQGSTGFYETVTTAGTSGTSTYGPTWGSPTTTDGSVVWTQGAAYPKNQACAMGNLRYLWSDENSYLQHQWIISGGDTVIVRQNSAGYDSGASGNVNLPSSAPINCVGNGGACFMPTIPSGTSARHTRILGENYASCHANSAKTLLDGTWGMGYVFNTLDSQYVDIACFEVTDRAECGGNSDYTHACTGTDSYATNGLIESALTSNVNYTDLYIHGLANGGIFGATGKDVVADHIELSGLPSGGGAIDMDDVPWGSGNMSVAGGFTLTNSLTQFSGCVEQYPITLTYPFIECRDQATASGIAPDGLGTAATTGTWTFDHDIWFYNMQDGLDLLHSGMQSLTVTNSQSIANDGQAYKIGSADSVVMQNDFAEVNCNRVAFVYGDMPSSAVVPGVTTCRASGDGIVLSFTDVGSYKMQNNTYVGYNSVSYDMGCDPAWDYCNDATAIYQNNVVLGYSNPLWTAGGGQLPALFFLNISDTANMPSQDGWSVRDHDNFYNIRAGHCPTPNTGETCTTNPLFASQPASPISAESQLDNFTVIPASGTGPLMAAGTAYSGIPSTDIYGTALASPPQIGAATFAGTPTAMPPTFTPGAGTYTGTQSVTLATVTPGATICYTTDGSTPLAATPGTCSHGTTYSTPVSVATSQTLNAIATEASFLNSSVGTAPYVITVAAPTNFSGHITISGTVVIH